MRGVSSIFVALGLLGFAAWSYLNSGFSGPVMGALAGAGFFLFRAYQGIGFSPIEDATTPIEFIANPRDAIVDCATGQLEEFLGRDDGESEDKPKFDPDAIIARYMETRPAASAEVGTPNPAPAGFGRKGL